jgi:phosphoglycolate phosphatase
MPMSDRYINILFDLDGTLADTLPDVANCVNRALEEMDHPPLSMEQVRKAVGPGKDEFIRAIFPDIENPDGKTFLTKFRKVYWDHCLDKTRLFPGMDDVLSRLKDRNLGVASNKPKVYSERILDGLGVRDCFADVLGPEDVVHAKPHPEMIIKFLNRIGGKPSKTVLIGDTDKDILAGRGAGVGVCGVSYGYGEIEKIEQLNPDFLIDTPKELLEVVGNHQDG